MVACSAGQMFSFWKALSLMVKGHPEWWGQGWEGTWTTASPGVRIPTLSTAPGASGVSAPSWITTLGYLCHRDVRTGRVQVAHPGTHQNRCSTLYSWKLCLQCPPKSKQKTSRFGLQSAMNPQPLNSQHVTGAVAFTGPFSQNYVPRSSF